jgi:hypothetical protein
MLAVAGMLALSGWAVALPAAVAATVLATGFRDRRAGRPALMTARAPRGGGQDAARVLELAGCGR